MIMDSRGQDWFDRNISVHHSSIVYPGVEIENGVEIGEFAVIGKQAEIIKGYGSHPIGKVIIRKGAVIRPHVTIDSGTTGTTVIGAYCFLMAKSHVGHDAVLGDRVTLSPGAVVGGHATIGEDANLGINSAVHQNVAVPKKSMVGMLTAYTKKLAGMASIAMTYVGASPRVLGKNKKWET